MNYTLKQFLPFYHSNDGLASRTVMKRNLEQVSDWSVEEAARQLFQEVVTLSEQITLYLPSRDRCGEPISAEALTKKICEYFLRFFGGVTVRPAFGSSLESLGVVREEITIITSFATPSALKTHLYEVLGLAKCIRDEFSQDTIALVVNNSLYLLR